MRFAETKENSNYYLFKRFFLRTNVNIEDVGSTSQLT